MQGAVAGASVIPVVGGTIAGILKSLSSLAQALFKGADPTQVASAEIQQAYDILGLNLQALGGALIDPVTHDGTFGGPKMLPQQLLIDACQAVTAGCEAAEAAAEATGKVDVSVYRRSLANIQTDMSNYSNAASACPGYAAPCNTPVSLAAARALYFSTLLPANLVGPGHWYAWSVQQGQALTDQFVQLLPQGVILE
jgi:hypothetical protein